MALNTSKCNHLTPLAFKGLNNSRQFSVLIVWRTQEILRQFDSMEVRLSICGYDDRYFWWPTSPTGTHDSKRWQI